MTANGSGRVAGVPIILVAIGGGAWDENVRSGVLGSLLCAELAVISRHLPDPIDGQCAMAS